MVYRKKYGYEEYFMNDSHIKKLYNMYLEKSIYNKVLDKLVFFAMMMIVMSVVMSIISDVDGIVLLFLNSLNVLILTIFGLELLRAYARSRSGKDFLKHHWIDFTLLVFLSFYFFIITTLGYFFRLFDFLKPFAQETKEIRAIWKLILRR